MFNIYCKKANTTLAIDFNAYPEHVQQHLIEYGLKQKFNDCLASETDESLCKGLLNNLQERLRRGELAKRVGESNPTTTKLKTILRKLYTANVGGKSADINKLSTEELVKALATKLNKPAERILEHFTTIATKQLEKEREEQAALLTNLDL